MAKAKGKKKKDQDDVQEQKPARIRLPRRSRTSTRERAENRQARHERQAGRKETRLVARIEVLEALLIANGVKRCDFGSGSVGERYKRLWRAARRNGLVGTPIKRSAKKTEAVGASDAPEPESPQVPETTA